MGKQADSQNPPHPCPSPYHPYPTRPTPAFPHTISPLQPISHCTHQNLRPQPIHSVPVPSHPCKVTTPNHSSSSNPALPQDQPTGPHVISPVQACVQLKKSCVYKQGPCPILLPRILCFHCLLGLVFMRSYHTTHDSFLQWHWIINGEVA